MSPHRNPPKEKKAIVFWIIWFAILQGVFILQFFIGGGLPKGSDQGSPPLWVLAAAGTLALLALAIRFRVIPKIAEVQQRLPAMIAGLAVSEGISLLGVFALGKEFPATQVVFFVMAVFCIMTFAPIYAQQREVN
jgi:hypothetical protein